MREFSLQPADAQDAPILAEIHEECFPRYWNHEMFTDFFSVSGTFAYVVLPFAGAAKEKAVAMIVYRLAGEQADIITLAVRPPCRRMGLGRRLMEHALQHLEGLGGDSLFLDVEDGNRPALSLYEALGFTQCNRRRLYYRQKDGSYTDALVMTKKL